MRDLGARQARLAIDSVEAVRAVKPTRALHSPLPPSHTHTVNHHTHAHTNAQAFTETAGWTPRRITTNISLTHPHAPHARVCVHASHTHTHVHARGRARTLHKHVKRTHAHARTRTQNSKRAVEPPWALPPPPHTHHTLAHTPTPARTLWSYR